MSLFYCSTAPNPPATTTTHEDRAVFGGSRCSPFIRTITREVVSRKKRWCGFGWKDGKSDAVLWVNHFFPSSSHLFHLHLLHHPPSLAASSPNWVSHVMQLVVCCGVLILVVVQYACDSSPKTFAFLRSAAAGAVYMRRYAETPGLLAPKNDFGVHFVGA